jgi:2-phospho-L-lactate guanylyltransferase
VTAAARADWGVVVPVKRLAVAKSRLAAFGDDGRRRLALAFAQDVVRAALACPGVGPVLVVTDDDAAAQALGRLGALVQGDRPDAGLNPALEHGAALLRAGDGRLGVAALSSDLPALRPDDLAAALAITAVVEQLRGEQAPEHVHDPRHVVPVDGQDDRRTA